MRVLRSLTLMATLATTAGLSACRSGNAYDIANRQANDVMLIVENQNFADVDIYALSSGLSTRIGTVSGGNSTARFALSPTVTNSTDFRLIATPIGGNGRASSGTLVASPGRTIRFTIMPNLATSHAEVQ
ncbi:MAG: hypothetical protein JWL61_47 [Gemmatimonadetes bacterium]|nr:hypothetical protein [Gemmatimonadota bacterium]